MEGQEVVAVAQEVTVPRAVDTVPQEAQPRHHRQGPQEPLGLLLQGPLTDHTGQRTEFTSIRRMPIQ